MYDKLEKRVERLEADFADIKNNMTVLTIRSEYLATKADVTEGKSEIKCDIANLKVEFAEAMDKRFDKIMDEMNRRFDKVDDNTKWRWSGIIVPVCIAIFTAVVTVLAGKFVG